MPTPTHRSAREDPVSVADGWLQIVAPQGAPALGAREGPLDLVLFDMDGTLIEGSSWEILHHAHGVSNEENWLRYQRGELDDVEFIRRDIALWHVGDKRPHVDDLEAILQSARIMDGAKEVVDALRARGVATCILSGGLDLIARRVCLELGIDMYVANGLRLAETGHLDGEGIVFVEIRDKGRMAREILRKLGARKERTAAVGNSAYDVGMFRECGFGVAFNPSDTWVRRAARHVVEGTDMRPVAAALLQGAQGA